MPRQQTFPEDASVGPEPGLEESESRSWVTQFGMERGGREGQTPNENSTVWEVLYQQCAPLLAEGEPGI